MAVNTVPQIASIVNASGVQFLEKEGQILFSSEEIGRQLGYKNPSKSINVLFSRNQKELASYATGIKVMQVDGCLRESRCFTEEGVYILSMLANTPAARSFRARLAQLLREIREHRENLAHQSGYAHGLSKARSLPAVQAQRKSAYLDGMKEGAKIQKRKDGLIRLGKIMGYLQKGLKQGEIARILGVSRQCVSETLRRARVLGVLA